VLFVATTTTPELSAVWYIPSLMVVTLPPTVETVKMQVEFTLLTFGQTGTGEGDGLGVGDGEGGGGGGLLSITVTRSSVLANVDAPALL
jgi:hypothetical protein